jgi:hypothetical protein
MNKGLIFGIVGGLVVIIVAWVAIVAANVGGEASKMDSMLKDDIKQHKAVDEVKKQLTDAGYTIEGAAPNFKATGPKHSLVVYTTWLTLDLGFDADGTIHSYHLDRAS